MGPSHSVPHAKATEGGDDAEDQGGCDTLGPVPRPLAGCAFASLGFCALGVSDGPRQSAHLAGSRCRLCIGGPTISLMVHPSPPE
jgi:hypothetical protein